MIDNGFAPGYSSSTESTSSFAVSATKLNGTVSVDDNVYDEESEDEFGKFESKGESLLTLVQPELTSLAKHWLAALRDHALLQLPAGI